MKRVFTLAFLICCLSAIALTIEKPWHFLRLDRPQDIQNLNATLDDLYARKQEASFTVFTTTPTLNDLPKGGIVLFVSGGAYRMYVRINDALIRFDGVKVN